ncbi:MAG: hypothetical protein WD557_05890 [Dehalococcoidia bacterium]
MGKLLIFVVALSLAGTTRCYSADPEATLAGVPILGAMVATAPQTPAYVETIGTPAASALPEADLATWFQPAEGADPYDVPTWQAIDAFAAHSSTPAGWTELCKAAGAAAGSDRAANPKLGALACSDDGSVTQLQRFAADLLSAQSRVALYLKGAPDTSVAAIQARQSEIRLACTYGAPSRQGGEGSVLAQACTAAQDTAYLHGDAAATFAALGAAYELVANEIARLDPTVDPEPGFFEADAP